MCQCTIDSLLRDDKPVKKQWSIPSLVLFMVFCFIFVFLLGEWVGAYLMLGAYWQTKTVSPPSKKSTHSSMC